MRSSYLILLLGMNVFWAGSYSAFKALSVRLTAGEIVTWRFTLAALVLAALWPLLPGRGPRGLRELTRTAIMGILVFAVGPRLQVLGVQLGKASDSAIVVALEPIVTVVAAALVLREHVPTRRWAGFALGITGVVLLNGGWNLNLDRLALGANLVFLSSFLCESAYSVMGKPLLEHCSPAKTIGTSLLCGAFVNLALEGPHAASRIATIQPLDWALLAFLSLICTVVGYTLWFIVIRETDVNLAALTILAQPILGVLIAALFLGEHLHWGHLWGALAILTGLILGLLPRSAPAPLTPAPAPPGTTAS